ncbi:hypothetical protein RhiirA5_431249 [Rhizophagus irregularis]|uniref:Protein kinase domain-containing protein n=1 Tax=Rhizophagus irregularis TaxID=588596 RepID=A0A2N0NVC2_9GLOM|nr:hypothetical protein RhiirA5_431252 [Rhizophagus irregularis]PKB98522.1 hypothetical protein RhiirA5_431249 [Rhizophagus irregularis]
MSHIKIPKWINLIEEHISKKHIKCYEYNNFSNLKVIGTGGFGKVYRANWKSSHSTLVLKPFNDATADKIVYELKIQRDIEFHKYIVKFLGITIGIII